MTKKGKIESQKLIKLNHYLIGFGLIVKGIDKAEHFNHFPLSVIFFFVAGAVIIIGTLFHHQVEKILKRFDAAFFLLEGVAFLLAGLILLEKEGSKIPYFLLFISLLYMIIGAALLFTKEASKEKVMENITILLKYLFLSAALITLVVNIIFFNSVWMYIMAIMLVASGLFGDLIKKLLKRQKQTI